MNSILAMAIATASIAAAGAAMAADISFHEQEGFRGRTFAADESVSNLAYAGFNDRASSLVIRDGTWQVCSDAYFRGRCVTLPPGRYPSLQTMGLDNRVSSAREVGFGGGSTVARGRIELFGRPGFAGRSLTVERDEQNLEGTRFNDRASSAIIHEGSWVVCEDANYRGTCQTLGPGQYPDLGSLTRQISSLRLANYPQWGRGRPWGSDARAILYEGRNLSGRHFVIDRNVLRDLDRTGFNDRASSLRVEAGYWVFCSDSQFEGECRTFGPGDYPTLPYGLENRISSGRRIHDRYPYDGSPAWQSPWASSQ